MRLLRINELLQKKQKSQRWLARQTGIALPTINAMTRGTRTYLRPSEEEKIAKALNVKPEELYYQGG